VQDPTGGIEIYKAGAPPATFALGDSVTFTGAIDQYRGNTEIVMTSWTKHASGQAVPAPLVLTCYELDHSYQPNNCEPNEGRLVRINHVTYAGTWPSYSGTLTLSDSTGTCTLFIDGDTGVQNVTPPGGRFDVIGILKQFDDYSPPFNTGYELIPRYPSDIIPHAGPQIVAGPLETDIRGDQVTIAWTTDTPATSRVDYGLTTGYELGTVEDPALVTEHEIILPYLNPATIHHYRVTSANEDGATQSGDKLFCSGSGPEVTGTIQVYFNKSVDLTLALGVPAQGNVNLMSKLLERINAANYSIDICLYSFDLLGLADAIIAAHNRGVAVRFVYDDRDGNGYQTQVQRLIAAGITVVDDAFGNNSGDGLMHNKFWIFDHRNDSPDGEDDWVVTGSHNATNDGTYGDAQNIVVIQDAALATIYQAEFDEMWGSSTDVPDAGASRFGANKLDNTPKRLSINGVPAQVYFSPSDGVIQAAIQEVLKSQASVEFCILSFTRFDLAVEMREKYYNVPGYTVRGVFDAAEGNNQSSQYADMKGTGSYPWNPPADVWLDTESGDLHHKYMILDANRHDLAPAVITGSANWSTSADGSNDENMIIIQDFDVANQYYQEFARRYTVAGGTGYLAGHAPSPAPASAAVPFYQARAFPNPARASLTLRYSLPEAAGGMVALYSADGRRESVLYQGEIPGGIDQRLALTLPRNASIAAGVHFLRMELGDREIATRLLLLR